MGNPMPHRIEITFVGDAPEDELARARILAGSTVTEAVQALSDALLGAGLKHEVTVHTIRTGNRAGKSGRPRLVAPERPAAE